MACLRVTAFITLDCRCQICGNSLRLLHNCVGLRKQQSATILTLRAHLGISFTLSKELDDSRRQFRLLALCCSVRFICYSFLSSPLQRARFMWEKQLVRVLCGLRWPKLRKEAMSSRFSLGSKEPRNLQLWRQIIASLDYMQRAWVLRQNYWRMPLPTGIQRNFLLKKYVRNESWSSCVANLALQMNVKISVEKVASACQRLSSVARMELALQTLSLVLFMG